MTTITIDRAVVQQALEAIEDLRGYRKDIDEAITALRAALAQEQEPEPIRHAHQWFRTGGMEPGQMRCIHCGKWRKETFDE